MNFEDKKLQELVDAAKVWSVAVESVEVDDDSYPPLEAAEKQAHRELVDYCLSLMPKSISENVKNSKLFASKLIDKYVFSQI